MKFDVRRKFQWEDVKREIDAAVEEYNKQRSWSRPIRKVGRACCENASNLEVLLTFIPDGEYTSIICGALTLVYNVSYKPHFKYLVPFRLLPAISPIKI